MHMPFCTVADRCLRCDNFRAGREIKRLREVLRVTLDELIAEREEVKELNIKVVALQKQLFEIQYSVALAQKGKVSVNKIKVPEPKGDTPVPNSVMQGIFC